MVLVIFCLQQLMRQHFDQTQPQLFIELLRWAQQHHFDYTELKQAAELLFSHLSLRAGRKSTIITTNLSFDRWTEIFGDEVLTAAMVDRLTHKPSWWIWMANLTASRKLSNSSKMLNFDQPFCRCTFNGNLQQPFSPGAYPKPTPSIFIKLIQVCIPGQSGPYKLEFFAFRVINAKNGRCLIVRLTWNP